MRTHVYNQVIEVRVCLTADCKLKNMLAPRAAPHSRVITFNRAILEWLFAPSLARKQRHIGIRHSDVPPVRIKPCFPSTLSVILVSSLHVLSKVQRSRERR